MGFLHGANRNPLFFELPRGSTESPWIISDMIRFITVNKEKRSSTIWRFPDIGIAPNHLFFGNPHISCDVIDHSGYDCHREHKKLHCENHPQLSSVGTA